MRFSRLILTAAAAIAVTSTALAAGSAKPAKHEAMGETTNVKVTMGAQNGSKESGTATLQQKGKDVVVSVDLNNAPKGAQPAHIHMGTCAKLNPAPKYPLSNVVNGKSTTTIKNVDLDELVEGKYAINVHKSANDLKTYVSCGEIKK
jgi:Cu/Zn superoxide dismutase